MSNEIQESKKTALIWGASGGIGFAVTKKLMGSGWQVIAIARDTNQIEASYKFQADVADSESVERTLDSVKEVTDSVDLFIYAVGDISAESVGEHSLVTWNRIMNANLTGAYITTHFSLPLLAKKAHLVFLGAISENIARIPKLSAYAASKGGLESFLEVLKREERRKRISLVRPSAVKTKFWDRVPFSAPAEAKTPDQIADAIIDAYLSGHKGVLDLI